MNSPPHDSEGVEIIESTSSLPTAIIPNNVSVIDLSSGNEPISSRTQILPGPVGYIHDKYASLRDALTAEIIHHGLHTIMEMKAKKKVWFDFYERTLAARGLMETFIKYTCKDPEKKFRTFILAGVMHDANRYEQKTSSGDENVSDLEIRSYGIDQEMKALKAAADEKAKRDEQRLAELRTSKEYVETRLGLRVSTPSPTTVAGNQFSSLLGPQPSTRAGEVYLIISHISVLKCMISDQH
jgi:hypothetical protein